MGQEYTRQLNIVSISPNMGQILLKDDFEEGEKFDPTGTGTDFITELSQAKRFLGTNSLHLKTRYTGAAANDYVETDYFISLQPSGIVKLETYFLLPSITLPKDIQFIFLITNGSRLKTAEIKYDVQNGKWQYQAPGGTYSDITGADQILAANTWHKVTIVVDFINFVYKKLISDTEEYDLSDLTTFDGGANTAFQFDFAIKLVSNGSTPSEAYIDNILLTNNQGT